MTFAYSSAIWKVTSGDLLTKEARRKKIFYTRNTYIFQLLFNVLTAGIEALVKGNKFLYACVKQVCRLRVQPLFDAFHQLLITVEEL
jgi:hypothetical protein